MKVIHLFRTRPDGYGLMRNILCTLPGLVRHGVDTIAVPASEARSGPTPESFLKQLTDAGVRVMPLEYKGRMPFSVARQLSDIMRRERPQVIHTHGYKTDLTMLLAHTADAVRITTIHGWLGRTRKERFFERLNARACKRMDGVIVFCEDYRRRLTHAGLSDSLIHTVPVGLGLEIVPSSGINFRREWNVPDGARVIAQVGRLSQEKRPALFIAIAAALAKPFPDARFILIGRGTPEMESRLHAQADGLSNLTFAGHVDAMNDALDAIDIAVNCSSTEAMPRTLLEAALKETPAVATAVGAVPDIIEDNVTGILCPVDGPEALRDGVARLLADPGLRTRMGQAARHRVETTFNTDISTQNLMNVYQDLIKRRKDSSRSPGCCTPNCGCGR